MVADPEREELIIRIQMQLKEVFLTKSIY